MGDGGRSESIFTGSKDGAAKVAESRAHLVSGCPLTGNGTGKMKSIAAPVSSSERLVACFTAQGFGHDCRDSQDSMSPPKDICAPHAGGRTEYGDRDGKQTKAVPVCPAGIRGGIPALGELRPPRPPIFGATSRGRRKQGPFHQKGEQRPETHGRSKAPGGSCPRGTLVALLLAAKAFPAQEPLLASH